MKTTTHVCVLFLLFALLPTRTVLFAQGAKGSQEKSKGSVETTDLGNPATVAQPTAAERVKAEQLRTNPSHPAVRLMKGTARQSGLGTKPPEEKTVRGSRQGSSKLTAGEIRKLREAHLIPPEQNK